MRGDPTLKQVALTFDDGPDGQFTPRVLDVLRQAGVKATFFVVGLRAMAHPEVLRRIVAEGHEIGNHTFHHPLLTRVNAWRLSEELISTDRVLRSITGRPVTLFRPPYGASNPAILKAATGAGYRLVLWDIDSQDWMPHQTTAGVLQQVLPNLRNGAIILQHAAGGRGEDLTDTVQALPQIIAAIQARGYRMVTVSELLTTGKAVPNEW